MSLPVGINVPQDWLSEPGQMGRVRDFAARAEALGFDSLWVTESVTNATPNLDPIAILSYLAACTSKVRLGVAVMLLTLHNPIQLAKSVASLDYLSDGRLDLGLGIGQGKEAQFGYPADKRVGRFLEMLDVMKAFWTEERANHQGERWQLTDLPMQPKPVQRPHPPIWLGGRVRAVVRRAVQHGDGFVGAGMASSEDFMAQLGWLYEELAAAGVDPAGFRISKRVYLTVSDSPQADWERARAWFQAHYGNGALADRITLVGSPALLSAELNRLINAGAKHLLLNPLFDETEQMERLAAEVVPNLGAANG
ncbi:MAG: LLM class flavin-dependent oxidoreductase [Anaerolineales bacterium]|nr:LLM class flavin-dependent oxidoreductase [Anaerolineales bacterium]